MADEIDALIAQVVIDAYGEDEQLWSFRQWFEDTATFPFRATVVGAEVEVIDIDYDGDDRRGLVARCTRDGQQLLGVAPRCCPGSLYPDRHGRPPRGLGQPRPQVE